LLGHNLLRHDCPFARIAPDLKFLNKPVVDTLFLSPLAFPENPYHGCQGLQTGPGQLK